MEYIIYLCCILISFAMGFSIAMVKVDRLTRKVRLLTYTFNRVTDLVFTYGMFHDDSGKATGDYNSDQVADRWNVFNALCRYHKEIEQEG